MPNYFDLLYSIYTGDGVTTDFQYTASYIAATDVKATVNGVDTALTPVDTTTFRISPAPADQSRVVLYRDSDVTAAKYSFPSKVNIKTENLDGNSQQNVFLHQETRAEIAKLIDESGFYTASGIVSQPNNDLSASNVQDALYEVAAVTASVETGADVTDTENVNAAGAIMHTDVSGDDGMVLKTSAESYTAVKYNRNATAPPTVNDDITLGYTVGSLWVDRVNDDGYLCVDSTEGAAVWIQTATSTPTGVQSVAGAAPIQSSGGANPTISILAATGAAAGSMSATDKTFIDAINASATQLNYNVITTLGTVQANRTVTADASAYINFDTTSGARRVNWSNGVNATHIQGYTNGNIEAYDQTNSRFIWHYDAATNVLSTDSTIQATTTDDDLNIDSNGTGDVKKDGVPINGTEQNINISGGNQWTLSIPSWCTVIEFMFEDIGVSHAGTDLYLQLGDSGGFETTGYTSLIENVNQGGGAIHTTKIPLTNGNVVDSSSSAFGNIKLSRSSTTVNDWSVTGTTSEGINLFTLAATKSTSSTTTSMRFTNDDIGTFLSQGSIKAKFTGA